MLPARDRITALYVYPTKADALAKTNGTEYTQGIVDETPRLERPFFTALPAFGECNAAMFECELNINVDLKGKWIRVATLAYATDAATTRTTYWLFCGIVDDCKYDVRQATRRLVAYDEMYRLRSIDVSTWWKEWWATQTGTVAVGTALSAMMVEYGVQGTAASTLANYFGIKADEQKKGLFGGGSFVQVLRYIGLVCACSFYIDKDGKLTACLYSNVNKTNTATAIDANVDTVNSTFGDAAGETFGSAQINVGSETAYRSGTAEPTFAQNDNPLLSGYTAANYMTVVSQLYAVAQKMSGLKAAEIELIVSTPDIVLERTQAISYGGDTLMPSSIILHGRQLIDETVYCTGELADAPLYQAAITEENIADGAVTAGKIRAGAVEAGKIAVGAVTSETIASSVDMATNAGVAATYATKATASSQEQRIYYRSNSTSAPSAPSSWVTSTATANATWTTKRMQYDSTYKYLWTCIQRKTVSGAISNSTVLLDDTTTVIDGGNIITGTVTANKINVSDLSALNATIGGLAIASNAIKSSNNTFELKSDGTIVSTNADYGNQATLGAGSFVVTDRDDKEADYDFGGITLSASGDNPDFSTFVYLQSDEDGVGSPSLKFWTQNRTDGTEASAEYSTKRFTKTEKEGTSTNYNEKILTAGGQSFVATNRTYSNGSWTENYMTEQSAGSFRVYEQGVQKAGLSSIGLRTFDANANEKSRLTNTELKVNGHDLLRMTPHFAQMFSTAIPANADLNTTAYLACKQYFVASAATAASLTNCPTASPFSMTVEAPNSATYDNENGSGEAYRIRKMTVLGGEEWVQYCYKTGTTWTYGTWMQVSIGVSKDTYANTAMKAGNLVARRNGNVVYIVSTGNATSVAAGNWRTYVTLAAKYRPSEETYATVTNAYGEIKTVRIRTNGNVDLYTGTSITSASNFAFTATYIVD